MQQAGWRLGVKRAMDVAFAGVGLVATAPVGLLAAAAVRISLGSPVLFQQTRPGRHGRPFVVYKLRTMKAGPGSDAARLTTLGRFLRASSVDEIPQLVNVLKGDMSLVGPRPLLMSYLARYTTEQARRHDVLPGITGWAQVNGRNALAHEERFALDVWYVDHWSLWLDVRIVLVTLLRVLSRRGVSASGHVTMPEFMGSTGEAVRVGATSAMPRSLAS